ncbi:MAG: gamma-glutamyl-phosphate reductase [Cyanobacteria bacterium P01_H01_bin.119]
MATTSSDSLNQVFQQARRAALQLAIADVSLKRSALGAMATALSEAKDDILEANTLDLETSREMAVSELILDWLKLTPERLQGAIDILFRLAAMGHIVSGMPTAGQLQIQRRIPLGVVALIYEAFPELGAIAAGLSLCSSNGLILRGGSEASQTNQMLVKILRQAIAAVHLPEDALVLLSPGLGETLREVVSATEIDLVIPYGRPSLIRQVVQQATVPVLRTVTGNCYLYWGDSGSVDTVLTMIVESHQGDPDAVNAIEKVLIPEDHSTSALTRLWNRLWEKGFELRGDPDLVQDFPDLAPVDADDWSQPYLTRRVAFQRTASLSSAIALINRYSSGHADCLATESYLESQQFTQAIRSRSVYINQSPRFARNPDSAADIALGVAIPGLQAGGRIGLESLTRSQRVWIGTL